MRRPVLTRDQRELRGSPCRARPRRLYFHAGPCSGSLMIDSISAVTLATRDMRRAVRFYRMLGFELLSGGEEAKFTSFRAGPNFLNLILQPAERRWSWWGRLIFYVSDVDGLHSHLVAAGCRLDTTPRDAEWGERFFHLTDPDGHELSFARPLRS